MPVHNGEDFLELSIRSILSQTLSEFELVILDDASTDDSWKIMQRYATDDNRIRLIKNANNLGLVATLNLLIEASCGELIARQDHDDISADRRLEKQAAYMDAHPDIGLLGTAYHEIDMAGNILQTIYQPETDTEVRWKILFANPFAHTTVMFRRSVIINNNLRYSNIYPHSEDYELWIRMLSYTRAANLAEPLASWRRNEMGISQTHTEDQSRNSKLLSVMQLSRLLSHPVSEEDREAYFCMYTERPPRDEELEKLLDVRQILRTFFRQQEQAPDPEGLRKNRVTMVNGLLVSLFNGLTLYGYYRHPGVYRLLLSLLFLDPPRVISFVIRKVFNYIKKKF